MGAGSVPETTAAPAAVRMAYESSVPAPLALASIASVTTALSRAIVIRGSWPRVAGRRVTGASAIGRLIERPAVGERAWYPATTARVAAAAHGIAGEWYQRRASILFLRHAGDAVM